MQKSQIPHYVTVTKKILKYVEVRRLQKIDDYTAVNLQHWKVCDCAFVFGKKLKIPAYRFLKVPLIRRFGEKWYKEVETIAELLKETKESNV
ncbi:MAG: DUF3109 family protein [Paludibacteraceae bacterium]|nr:DUF3109 family protein [Paludibacteraceae bacterium]